MDGIVLVLNAGSSSLKFSAFEVHGNQPELALHGQVESLYSKKAHFVVHDAQGQLAGQTYWEDPGFGHHQAIEYLEEFLRGQYQERPLLAVGHRVVHGGREFSEPALVTPEVLDKLKTLAPLAPLHQPHNLEPIALIAEKFPQLPQVACFDTAFHHCQSRAEQAFALPARVTERGVQRYGFHGLSYEYISTVLPQIAPQAAGGRTIVAHLGNGESMCAINGGKSVASTMGFTAVDGLPMGTRCGSLDPGVILYLMTELGMDAHAIEAMLYKESGLLGISGVSSDMRTLLASDHPEAQFALDVLVHRIGRELGALAATMQGLDALVFTAGIGEHSAAIRARICREAAWLGLELDAEANERGEGCISAPGSKVSAWVIPTNEELMIARHTLDVTGGAR